MWDIPIFCINMRTSTTRRRRMEQRFDILGLRDHLTFVDGITPQSSIIAYYMDVPVKEIENTYGSLKQGLRDIACLTSHLKCVRAFLETSADACFICEDDILFHNNFIAEWEKIQCNIPSDANLVSLGWMLTGAIDKTYVGKNPQQQNLWHIDPNNTWGGQCYYIRKEYALEVISQYDRPLSIIKANSGLNRIPPEIIIHRSNGYMVTHPIVIEDCIDSDRAPHDLPFHLKHWCYWDYKKYNKYDAEQLSPLAKLTPKDAWEGYPY